MTTALERFQFPRIKNCNPAHFNVYILLGAMNVHIASSLIAISAQVLWYSTNQQYLHERRIRQIQIDISFSISRRFTTYGDLVPTSLTQLGREKFCRDHSQHIATC